MTSNIIKNIFFKLSRARLASYGLVTLCLITLIVFYKLIPIKKLELNKLQENTKALLQPSNSDNRLEPTQSPVSKLYKDLPESRQIDSVLAFVFKLAADKKLTIDTINYQLEEQPKVTFAIYKIQAPVTGSYLDLMKFIQKILETYPYIALTNLSISRENSQSNLIDAEFELSVYFKKDL